MAIKKTIKIPPMIILIRGKPATGKSFITRFLSKKLNIPFIDKDDIKDVVDYYFLERNVSDYFCYAILFNIAISYLESDSAVICDSPLFPQYAYFRAKKISDKYQVPIRVIHTVIEDTEQWKERMNKRYLRHNSFHRYTNWESREKELLEKQPYHIPGELMINLEKFGEREKNKLLKYVLK